MDARTWCIAVGLVVLGSACASGAPGEPTAAPGTTPAPAPAPGADAGTPAAPAPPHVWGVTVDDPWRAAATADALAGLPRPMTARVVFDEGVAAADYVDPVRVIGGGGAVMGELLDSYYVSGVTPAEYQARAHEYVTTLGPLVSIWEVGNEVNGEWLGAAQDVVAKITAAEAEVKAAGGKTALTLYFNDGCWARPENEMFTWVDANLPASLRDELDYVWVSYYEDDCNGLQPDWNTVFRALATRFPNAALGFGECGTTNVAAKPAYLARYYGAQVDAHRFVGGGFWWYFSEDMVPASQPLWTTLRDLLAAGP